MSRYRFVDFSLYKRTDELLRPSEMALEREFKSKENKQLVYKTVVTQVNPRATFRSVTDEMEDVFRSVISKDTHPSIDEMNSLVYQKLTRSLSLYVAHRERYVERAYENSNIPKMLLPRPSMNVERGMDDEARGKFTIEFTR